MSRADPFHGFRFRIEFDQVEHGGFARVKGLVRETKVDARPEGGVNDFEHRLATRTTYGNLILERGIADFEMWDWHDEIVNGAIRRRTITVVLFDTHGDEAYRWIVEDAFPVKWTGTDLDAAGSQVMFESVEWAHHGIRRGDA